MFQNITQIVTNKLFFQWFQIESKNFCNILMPSEDTKILQFNQSQKPDKAPSII